LAAASLELHAALAALDRCRQPVARLRSLMADCTSAEVDLENKRQQFLSIIGSWLGAGGLPPRPTEPTDLLEVEQRIARLQRDAAAARSALPDHEAVQSEAARYVAEATARRNAALRSAILAAVADCIERRLTPALQTAQEIERVIWEVSDHLAQRDDHAGVSEIRTRMYRIKTAQLAPPASAAAGRAFSDRILVDPSAELGPDR
jgi:hypothetical protein